MDNTISFKRGQGQQSISDYGDGNQTIQFGRDITPHHIHISEQDNAHIILTLVDDNGTETGDRLTLNYAFILEESAIERLEFANGDIISNADMLAAAQSNDITNDEQTEIPVADVLHSDIEPHVSAEAANETDISHQPQQPLRLVANDVKHPQPHTNHYLNITDRSVTQQDISYEELWFGRHNQNHLLSPTSQDDSSNIESLEVETSEQTEAIINGDTSFVNWQLEQLVFAMASYDAPAGVGNVIQQDTKDALQSIVVASY